MNFKQALECLSWQYPPPYEFYNVPAHGFAESWDEIFEDNGMDFYAVLDQNGDLFGMFVYSFDDGGVMEIGLGIRPIDTGKGKGRQFLQDCLTFGTAQYGYVGKVRLRVASFNARAISLYESCSFVCKGAEETEAFGVPVLFYIMERD